MNRTIKIAQNLTITHVTGFLTCSPIFLQHRQIDARFSKYSLNPSRVANRLQARQSGAITEKLIVKNSTNILPTTLLHKANFIALFKKSSVHKY